MTAIGIGLTVAVVALIVLFPATRPGRLYRPDLGDEEIP